MNLKNSAHETAKGSNSFAKPVSKQAIITSEDTKIVSRRAAKLSIDFLYQGAKDKGTLLREVAAKADVSLEEIAYIGDDVNDLPAFALAGLTTTPADGVEAMRDIADIVLSKKGGAGAVRELCELLLSARSR